MIKLGEFLFFRSIPRIYKLFIIKKIWILKFLKKKSLDM